MILYAKFGEHQPLNRQSESYAREGVDLDVSTLADWVGACTASLTPLVELIRRHVVAAERIHGDDTTVPVLGKGKTITGRVWTYVRDDRPFAGPGPPAAAFFYSRNRNGEHPARHLSAYAGILQADAYAGFGELYEAKRRPAPITEAACWSHGRRKFFVLADTAKAPLALEGVRRIALGRRSWLFAGSDRGGERAAAMYTLIVTAKLNDIDPQAWLADVLRRIADHPAARLDQLLPWRWKNRADQAAAA